MKEIWNWIQHGLSYFLGGFDGVLFTLIVFILADYVTGVFRAIIERNLSKKVGAQGLMKKVAIVIMVGIGNLIDIYLLNGGSALRTAMLFFYISNEGISLLENTAAIGLPIPQILRDVLAHLRPKYETKTSVPTEPEYSEYINPSHTKLGAGKENETEENDN